MKRNRVKINGELIHKEYLASFLSLKAYDVETNAPLLGIYFISPKGKETQPEYHYVQVVDGIPVAALKREEVYWK